MPDPSGTVLIILQGVTGVVGSLGLLGRWGCGVAGVVGSLGLWGRWGCGDIGVTGVTVVVGLMVLLIYGLKRKFGKIDG